MPGTKILNVQRNDSFDEVFDAFKQSDAHEVIFIFPRGSAFGGNAGFFTAVQAETARTGKTVNFMTADPIIADLASAHGFGILSAAPRRKKVVAIPPEDAGKKIKDIVSAEDTRGLAVKDSEEKEEVLEISRTPLIPPVPIAAPLPASAHIADIEKLWEEEEKRQNPESDQVVKKGISKKFIFIPAGLSLVVLGIILYATLGSAKVIIKPNIEDIDFKLKATAATTVEDVQAEFNKIPGQRFTVQQEAKGSYPSSTQKEVVQQAQGKITIYNTSASAQRLVTTTRFETSEGLIFRIDKTISVPASGSIEATVYADRSGKEYNIGPTRFTVPGFEGTPRYQQFYASSTAPMTGGIVGTAKVVSEQDFAKALEELTAKAKEATAQALKEQVGKLTYGEPLDVRVEAPTVNAKAGQAADTLEMSVRASLTVVAFRPEDLDKLIRGYLEKNGNLEPVEQGLVVESKFSAVDAASTSIQFETHVTGRAAAKIDKDKIMKDIQGMNEKALDAYFKSVAGVFSARISLWPFWVKRVPKNNDDIKLTIDTSQ